jgi:hypothetical protein
LTIVSFMFRARSIVTKRVRGRAPTASGMTRAIVHAMQTRSRRVALFFLLHGRGEMGLSGFVALCPVRRAMLVRAPRERMVDARREAGGMQSELARKLV